jgi:hypothetical protein
MTHATAENPTLHIQRSRPREPDGTYFGRQLHALMAGLISVAVAAPIALIAAPGIARVVGFFYLVLWILVMAPSTTTFLYLILDSILVLQRRRPVLLPVVMYAKAAGRLDDTAIPAAARRLAALSVLANPLGNVAVVALHTACSWREKELSILWNEAKAAAEASASQHRFVRRIPEVEFAEPVMELAEAACLCV